MLSLQASHETPTMERHLLSCRRTDLGFGSWFRPELPEACFRWLLDADVYPSVADILGGLTGSTQSIVLSPSRMLRTNYPKPCVGYQDPSQNAEERHCL